MILVIGTVEVRLSFMFEVVIIIRCKKKQVLEIIEHVKSKFQDVDISYEVMTAEL
jgi:hypothetical protein